MERDDRMTVGQEDRTTSYPALRWRRCFFNIGLK